MLGLISFPWKRARAESRTLGSKVAARTGQMFEKGFRVDQKLVYVKVFVFVVVMEKFQIESLPGDFVKPKILKSRFSLTPTLAGSDVAYPGGWSV